MSSRMREPTQRQLRVGEELRHVLSAIMERGNFRDPDLMGKLITVTEVRVSPDMRNADVFVTPLGGGDCTEILAGLTRSKSFLRKELGRKIHLKFTPDLRFFEDDTFEQAGFIENLLNQPKVRQDLDKETEDDGEDGA